MPVNGEGPGPGRRPRPDRRVEDPEGQEQCGVRGEVESGHLAIEHGLKRIGGIRQPENGPLETPVDEHPHDVPKSLRRVVLRVGRVLRRGRQARDGLLFR